MSGIIGKQLVDFDGSVMGAIGALDADMYTALVVAPDGSLHWETINGRSVRSAPDAFAPRETQATIEAWRASVFGPASSPARLAARANVEMAELISELAAGNTSKAPSEVADVLIVLYGVAQALGVDLHAEVDKKMAINRGRKWKVAGDGTGHHVRDKSKPETEAA